MRIKRLIWGKKGQIHTLEAIIAVVIMIIFAFSVLKYYSLPGVYESQSVEELKERGRSALTALDDSGKLKDWVAFDDADDNDNLRAALIEMLPSDVGFNLTVFSNSLGGTFQGNVNFGGSPPLDKPIATINYILRIGDTSDIDDVRYIKFQLWYL
jgi:hypothetical protein